MRRLHTEASRVEKVASRRNFAATKSSWGRCMYWLGCSEDESYPAKGSSEIFPSYMVHVIVYFQGTTVVPS